MATGKRYYWIKLKESFMTSDAVDFLMGQPDGANYVVLYQMLCLKTINTDGRLSRRIGEIIIPYDEQKIARDTKWFSVDTVRVALNLYKALGLVYQDVDGSLVFTDHANLVGSETDWAEKRRRQRVESQDYPELGSGDNVPTDVPTYVPSNVPIDIEIDIRDKEIREQSIDTEKEVKGTISGEIVSRADVRRVIEAWNSLGLQMIRKIPPDSQRGNMLRKRIKDYGIDAVLTAIEKVRASDFLNGNNGKGWTINFDWFVKPNNFPKVLDGNYDNRIVCQPASGNKVADSLHESYNMMAGWASKEDKGE